MTISPINSGWMRYCCANRKATGAMIATAPGLTAPTLVSSPVTRNIIHGIATTWPRTERTARRTSQSIVPLLCAIANRYVMPTSVTNRSPGKPDRTLAAVMSTYRPPTMKAITNASAPMLTGNTVPTTNNTTNPTMHAISGDMARRYTLAQMTSAIHDIGLKDFIAHFCSLRARAMPMPIIYSIDRRHRIISEVWSGEVSATDLADHWQRLLLDPDALGIRSTLV